MKKQCTAWRRPKTLLGSMFQDPLPPDQVTAKHPGHLDSRVTQGQYSGSVQVMRSLEGRGRSTLFANPWDRLLLQMKSLLHPPPTYWLLEEVANSRLHILIVPGI